MKAAAYLGHETVETIDLEPRTPSVGEVEIRVAYCGLCGTDLHIVHGNMDGRVSTPLIFGHEMSGTVERVGAGVEGWEPGDRVTVMPLAWDGTCPACRAGNSHICQNLEFIGIDSAGALQQRWTVPASTLVRLPESLSLRDAALAEPVAVAAHDVRRSELAAGDKVVILGGGPIGVLIAAVATASGAEVRVAELDDHRRALIERLGFGVLDPRENLDTAVEEWTAGAGADVVFEVSGASAAVESAPMLLKVRGTLVVVAIHPTPRPINLQRFFWRELRMLGARVYQREDFERALELLESGAIPIDEIVTAVVPLAETADAIARLGRGEAMKLLVDVAGAAA